MPTFGPTIGEATRFTAPGCPAENVDATFFSRAHDWECKWAELIDYKLIEWGSHPELLEDDGVCAPTRQALARGIDLAHRLAAKGWPAPQRVSPDGDGGIVFEWRENDVSREIRIWDDGTGKWVVFDGMKLVASEPLDG